MLGWKPAIAGTTLSPVFTWKVVTSFSLIMRRPQINSNHKSSHETSSLLPECHSQERKRNAEDLSLTGGHQRDVTTIHSAEPGLDSGTVMGK